MGMALQLSFAYITSSVCLLCLSCFIFLPPTDFDPSTLSSKCHASHLHVRMLGNAAWDNLNFSTCEIWLMILLAVLQGLFLK